MPINQPPLRPWIQPDFSIEILAITALRLALLINFKFADLRWKRVIR